MTLELDKGKESLRMKQMGKLLHPIQWVGENKCFAFKGFMDEDLVPYEIDLKEASIRAIEMQETLGSKVEGVVTYAF